MNSDANGVVYLIKSPSHPDLLKIGMSKDCGSTRLRSMQTGNPDQLTLVRQWNTNDPRALETALHRKFDRRRVQGEWFRVTEQEVTDAVNELTTGSSDPVGSLELGRTFQQMLLVAAVLLSFYGALFGDGMGTFMGWVGVFAFALYAYGRPASWWRLKK